MRGKPDTVVSVGTRWAIVSGPKRGHADASSTTPANPWNALWAMMVGFFMILVDSTIVAVANPSIMEKLHTDYDTVLWVTSAYLLAYAVPLLVAGRLGDRFGPKNLYIIGLFVFTAASLWCGLAGSIQTLVAARVLQGVGAALLTPQTLSTITRTFPPERRGMAMSVWGATAGVATLVGPLAGGVLVDHLGWQWIFFVNVPIGVIGLALAVWLIPVLPTQSHSFDWLGVLLSGAAMFLVVFGLQEGEDNQWSAWIWAVVLGGIVVMAVFVLWQSKNRAEPLVPLSIFTDRDFSLANIGVAVIGFAVTAMIVPVMFYAQVVCGLTPTRSALLTAPMAIATGVLAPLVGKLVDRKHPTVIIGSGFAVLATALTWLAFEMTPDTPIWRLLLPFVFMGVGMAFIWAPLAATATRNLPPAQAGAGSGVYNATRQVGSVLGSAGIAAFMSSRISAEMPAGAAMPASGAAVEQLPVFLRAPFATALSSSMLLPAFIALFGVVAALFLRGMQRYQAPAQEDRLVPADQPVPTATPATPATAADNGDNRWSRRRESSRSIPVLDDEERIRRAEWLAAADLSQLDEIGFPDGFVDDDDDSYWEYRVVRHSEPAEADEADTSADDGATEPLSTRVPRPPHAPTEHWHSAPVDTWHSMLDTADDDRGQALTDPIGLPHNRFAYAEPAAASPAAVDTTPKPVQPRRGTAEPPEVSGAEDDSLLPRFGGRTADAPRSRHRLSDPDDPKPPARHYRDPDDDVPSGRHAR